MSDHTRKVLKTCSTCGCEFQSVRELITHEIQHSKPSSSSTSTTKRILPFKSIISTSDDDDGRHFCKLCFGRYIVLIQHQKTTHFISSGKPLYYCSYCFDPLQGALNRNYFRKRGDFLGHMKNQHGVEKMDTNDSASDDSSSDDSDCSTTNDDGTSTTSITRPVTNEEVLNRLGVQLRAAQERRKETNAPGTYLCRYCFRQFAKLTNMLTHIDSYHRAKNFYYYFCDYCKWGRCRAATSFLIEAHFRSHLSAKHGISAAICDKNAKCGRTKRVRSDLSDAVDEHHRLAKESSSAVVEKTGLKIGDHNGMTDVKLESDVSTIDVTVKSDPDSSTSAIIECAGSSAVDMNIQELRSVKEPPMDEMESTAGQPRRNSSDGDATALRPVKEEPMDGESQSTSAFYVMEKSETEDDVS